MASRREGSARYPMVAEPDERAAPVIRDAWWYEGDARNSAIVVIEFIDNRVVQVKLRRRRRPQDWRKRPSP